MLAFTAEQRAARLRSVTRADLQRYRADERAWRQFAGRLRSNECREMRIIGLSRLEDDASSASSCSADAPHASAECASRATTCTGSHGTHVRASNVAVAVGLLAVMRGVAVVGIGDESAGSSSTGRETMSENSDGGGSEAADAST
jgi:hypothetical protein